MAGSGGGTRNGQLQGSLVPGAGVSVQGAGAVPWGAEGSRGETG